MTAPVRKAGRILLVEGTEPYRTLIHNMLLAAERMNYETQICSSLREAVEYVQDNDYAALIVAPELPDSDGIRTVDTLNKTVPDSPIVVLTGFYDVEVGRRAVREGKAIATLEKDGLDVEKLSDAVSKALVRN